MIMFPAADPTFDESEPIVARNLSNASSKSL